MRPGGNPLRHHTHDPRLGEIVGAYRLESILGSGRRSQVFAARDLDGNPFALKLLRNTAAADDRAVAQLRREATLAQTLVHDHIIRIHAVERDGPRHFYTMDRHHGSLADQLDHGPLPSPALRRLAQEMGQALVRIHQGGLVHGDVKPANILLAEDGRALICDFGVAAAEPTAAGMVLGSPAYMAPEQAMAGPVDGRADLYSLGVTLFRAATGRLPFPGTDWYAVARRHVEERPTAPSALRPDLSPHLETVILRCLAKHPDDRFHDAGVLLSALG